MTDTDALIEKVAEAIETAMWSSNSEVVARAAAVAVLKHTYENINWDCDDDAARVNDLLTQLEANDE